MLTKENIFGLIRDNSTPYWDLRVVKGYNHLVNAGSARLLNVASDASDKTKCEASVKELEMLLNSMSGYKHFDITLKPKPTSNGATVLGPFEFSANQDEKESNQIQGLGALPQNFEQMGYVPQSVMEQRLSLLQEQNNINLEKRLFEESKRRHEEDKARDKEYLGELERKFNSKSETLSNAAMTILEKGIGLLLGGEQTALSGTEENEEPQTEEEKIIEGIAGDIHQNIKSKEALQKLRGLIKQVITKNQTNGEISKDQ